MAHHRLFVVQIVGGDFDHLEAVIAKPRADLAVPLGRFRIAVQMRTHPVQVDAHTLVRIVILGAIDHVRRRGPQRVIEPNLLVPHSFAEPGGEQQVTQLGLRVVDGNCIVSSRRRIRLLPRYLVFEREPLPPFVDPFAGCLPIQVPVVVGVTK